MQCQLGAHELRGPGSYSFCSLRNPELLYKKSGSLVPEGLWEGKALGRWGGPEMPWKETEFQASQSC